MNPRITLEKPLFVTSHLGDVRDAYDLQQSIGQGAFGSVYKASKKTNHQLVAVKIINKEQWPDRRRLIKEVRLLQALDHPNICSILETYETNEYLAIVTKYYDGGHLFERVMSRQITNEQQLSQVTRKLLNGITYCHQRRVCHRDLKPENIMFASKDPNGDVKIIDFGVSESLDERSILMGRVGTHLYMAPEIFESEYTEVVDCWSLGVILYFVISGTYPFPGKTPQEVMTKICNCDIRFEHSGFKGVSDWAKDFISRLLIKDPSVRMTASQALLHPWIAQSVAADRSLNPFVVHGIQQYLASERLRRMALMAIASTVDDACLQRLNSEFLRMDLDKNGVVSKEEFVSVLREKTGESTFSPEVLELIWSVLDSNKNGQLDYMEFLSICLSAQSYGDSEHLREVFKFFDRVLLMQDKDGFITVQEVMEAMSVDDCSTPENAAKYQDVIREADQDGDGKVGYDDFLRMMRLSHKFGRPA